MKRSDFFIRLTTGVIFLAVLVYAGVSLYNYFINIYVTTPAISYTVEETLPARGYIVRTEFVLDDFGITALPVVNEGERVAAGQAIAVEHLSSDALEVASEIRSLRLKIAQLESARGSSDAASFDAILELSAALNSHDFRRLDELALNVETSVFNVETDITALQSRLEELEGREVASRTIIAPFSGTFSNVVDGFEHTDPDMIMGMSPSILDLHFSLPHGIHSTGKLIVGFKWYYAAIMDSESADQLSAKLTERERANNRDRTFPIRFYGTYNAEIPMFVEDISRPEDGMSVVLFSSDRGIHDVASLRSLSANIVFDVVSGIRVPMDAIRLDDSGEIAVTYVYLQTSNFAERVDVEILDPPGVIGDSYLVRDGLETGSPLRVDSTIIVRANNLYHGKVVG